MAYVVFTNGKSSTLPHDQALAVYNVLQGHVQPSPAQAAYCDRVRAIYLNWRADDCPGSYILERQAVLQSMYNGTPEADLLFDKANTATRAQLEQETVTNDIDYGSV